MYIHVRTLAAYIYVHVHTLVYMYNVHVTVHTKKGPHAAKIALAFASIILYMQLRIFDAHRPYFVRYTCSCFYTWTLSNIPLKGDFSTRSMCGRTFDVYNCFCSGTVA